MAFPYIPKILYPNQLDTDYSLYKVANSAETTLSADLEAWATTISVVPTDLNTTEIWSDNGYVNISGELIYYDSVDKNYATGKVVRLLNCIRNLSGEKPKFNHAGTPVRGYVVAQHHNQLAQGLVNLESFVGVANSSELNSLDYKLRTMDAVQNLGDDATCAQISFNYSIISADPIQGTTISYVVNIVGSYDTFEINFGDGTVETDLLTGTHTYSANYEIDPVVTVTSKDCQVLQVAPERTAISEPQPVSNIVINDTGAITMPVIPDFPNLDLSVANTSPIRVNLPPVIFPCFDIGPLGPIVIPSSISLTNPEAIPSTITLANPNAIPSTISFTNSPKIPSTITFTNVPNIPSTISLSGFYSIPSNITINPVVVNYTNSDYCVNCTDEFSLITIGDGTTVMETNKGCDLCPSQTEKVQKVQVVVHDFTVESKYGAIPSRYDLVKILIQDPYGKTCLIMGSGKPGQYPKYSIDDSVTLTFDDDSKLNLYNYDQELRSATYKPADNGNAMNASDGLALLDGAAPAGPYGTSLTNFADSSLSAGKWKAYVVVGVASPPKPKATKPPPTATPAMTPHSSCPPAKAFGVLYETPKEAVPEDSPFNFTKFVASNYHQPPTPTPTPAPLETPIPKDLNDNDYIYQQSGCTGGCTWQAVIIAVSATKPPSKIYGWVKTTDTCSEGCGCAAPTTYPKEGDIASTTCSSGSSAPVIVDVPQATPEPTPFTTCKISKICVRIFYHQEDACQPTPRPSVGPTYTACPTSFAFTDGYTYEEIKEIQKNYVSPPVETPVPTPLATQQYTPLPTQPIYSGVIRTDVKTAVITRPKLCFHAGREPLEMVKQGCGTCAIRSCNIYGKCSHTSIMANRPEVICCQNCPAYTLAEQQVDKKAVVEPPVIPTIILEDQKAEDKVASSKQLVKEIEIPVEIITLPEVPKYENESESKEIHIRNPLQIVQDYLHEQNKIKMIPKDSNIKIDVDALLGEDDEGSAD